jgi:Acetyltransferase (GNAT) domain
VSATSIRRAEPDDLPAVAAIYAQYVERTVVTFETAVPDAAAWRRRFDEVVARGLPFLVAVEAGRLVGYAYAGPWKERAAYRHTVESTDLPGPGGEGPRNRLGTARCPARCLRRGRDAPGDRGDR